MLIQIFLLFFLVFLLFLLSRKISQSVYALIFLLTGSSKLAVGVLAFLFLPGTFIHEFSHLVAAAILRVQVGDLTILPSVGSRGEIKAGSLSIAKPDPFRHILIGLAPMIIGLTIIYIFGKTLIPNLSNILNTKYLIPNTVLGFYLLFIASSTMFSSRKDLQSLIIAGPVAFLIAVSLYLVGIRIVFEQNLISKISLILSDLNLYLLIAAIIDYLIFILVTIGNSLVMKISGKRATMS